jgi:hypothetical protein
METVYAEPSLFTTVDELGAWLENWNYIYTIDYTVPLFSNNDTNDCDDKAIQMIKDMAVDGYIGGITHDYEHYVNPHMLVCVPVGNDLYFVEPLTKEVTRELGGYWYSLD